VREIPAPPWIRSTLPNLDSHSVFDKPAIHMLGSNAFLLCYGPILKPEIMYRAGVKVGLEHFVGEPIFGKATPDIFFLKKVHKLGADSEQGVVAQPLVRMNLILMDVPAFFHHASIIRNTTTAAARYQTQISITRSICDHHIIDNILRLSDNILEPLDQLLVRCHFTPSPKDIAIRLKPQDLTIIIRLEDNVPVIC